MERIGIPSQNHLALLLAATFFSHAAWAQVVDAPAKQAPPQAEIAAPSGQTTAPSAETAVAAPETAVPATDKDAAKGGNWFDTTTSAGQQAFTPSYEQGGRGQSGGITSTNKTAPARGTPIRTSSGLFIYPNLNVGLGYNDNIVGTSSGTISSTLITVQPNVVGEMKTRGDRYTVNYVGNFTKYNNSSDDNFSQNTLVFAGDNVFSSRAKFSWDVGYITRTDPRGSTDRDISSEPDRWHSPVASAVFAYGAEGATGRIEVEGSVQNKRYDNNRAFTETADVNLNNLAARFLYRVAPKTSMLFEARNTSASYQLDTSLLDNSERRYYVGATWEATAATTGIIKVGRLTKSFDSPGSEDFSGFSWEGIVRWKPRSYSTLELVTSKSTSDPTGFGDFLINRNLSVAWLHNWNSFLASRLTAGFVKTEYAGVDRNDNTKNFGLGLTYDMRRWLRLGVEWAGTRRTSSLPLNDFTRNVTMVTLEGTL